MSKDEPSRGSAPIRFLRHPAQRNGVAAVPLAMLLSLVLAACSGSNVAGSGGQDDSDKGSGTASAEPSRPAAKSGDPVEFDRVHKISEVAPIRDTIKVTFDETGGWKAVGKEKVGDQKHISVHNGAAGRDQFTYHKGVGPGQCSIRVTPGFIAADDPVDADSDEPASEHEQKWWSAYLKDDAIGHKVTDKEVAPAVLKLGDGGVEMDTHEYAYRLRGFGKIMDPGPYVERDMVRAFGDTGWVLHLSFACEGTKFSEAQYKEAMDRLHLTVAKPGKDYGFDVVPGIGKDLSIMLGFTQDAKLQDVEPVWYNSTDKPGATSRDLCSVTPWVGSPDPKAAKSSTTSDKPGSDIEQDVQVNHYEDKANLKADGWKSMTGAEEGEPVKVHINEAGQTVDFYTFEQSLTDTKGKSTHAFFLRRYFNAPTKTTIGVTLTCPTAELRDKYKDWVVRAAVVTTYKWGS